MKTESIKSLKERIEKYNQLKGYLKNINGQESKVEEIDRNIHLLETELKLAELKRRRNAITAGLIASAGVIGAGSIATRAGSVYEPKAESGVESSSDDIIDARNIDSTDATTDMQENDKYYNQISDIENNVTDFINDGLSKGLVNMDLTEDNKKDLAKKYLNYYLMWNIDELYGKDFYVLNQDGSVNSMKILEDSLEADLAVQEQAVVSTDDSKLDFNYLIKDEDDRKVIKYTYDIVSKMHTAYMNNDRTTFDNAIVEMLDVKNGMIAQREEYKSLDPMTEDQLLLLIDAADQMANGTIIKDDEADFLNQAMQMCVKSEYVSNMTLTQVQKVAVSLNIDVTNKTKEALLEEIQNLQAYKKDIMSIRSMIRVFADQEMQMAVQNSITANSYSKASYNESYSYDNVVDDIAKKIDITKLKKPHMDANTVINNIVNGFYLSKTNSYSVSKSTKSGSKVRTETHTTTSTKSEYVDKSQVPEKDRVPDSTTYTDANGKKTTKEALDHTKSAIEKGSKAGAEAAAKGDFTPSNTGDKEYDKEYNRTLNQGKEVYDKAKNDETVTYEKVDNGKEEVISTEDVPSKDKTISQPSTPSHSTSNSSSSTTSSHSSSSSSSSSHSSSSTSSSSSSSSSHDNTIHQGSSSSSSSQESVSAAGGEEEEVSIEDVEYVGSPEEEELLAQQQLEQQQVKSHHL